MHVRISDKGRDLLNNKALAHKVASAILSGKQQLEQGESVRVNGENVSVQLVTSIKDSTHQEKINK